LSSYVFRRFIPSRREVSLHRPAHASASDFAPIFELKSAVSCARPLPNASPPRMDSPPLVRPRRSDRGRACHTASSLCCLNSKQL